MVRLPPRLRPLFPYLKPAYVQTTRAVAPLTQALSKTRGGYLPSGTVRTLSDAARSSGGRYAQARAAERITRPAILGSPPGLSLTDTSDGESFEAFGAAELPQGRVLGPHRAVISGRGDLVHEVSWYFGTTRPREHPVFLAPFPQPPRHVPGRLGVLATRGDANYYHFLMDALPRISVLEQAGFAPPDAWYVPTGIAFQRELLDLLGIADSARVDAATNPHVQADVLVVPAQPDMTEKNPPWVVGWLRERLLPAVAVPAEQRRLYVTRGGAANNRAVTNDDEVRAALTQRGFERIDPGALSVREQIEAFASASVIVAAHGAALANLVFASPGSAVIELFPRGVLLPDYWRLACGVPGLTYRYLSAPNASGRITRQGAIVRDIEVDLRGLNVLLDELNVH